MFENTKDYCLPSTFPIPVLFKPFTIDIMPYSADKTLIVSHPERIGSDSELPKSTWEFDMSRYDDPGSNMLLGMQSVAIPRKYTSILLFDMSESLAYVYQIDYRTHNENLRL